MLYISKISFSKKTIDQVLKDLVKDLFKFWIELFVTIG